MKPRREGYVLVSVLWVVALLTVITLSYHQRARLDVQAARYALDSSQCRMAARGAVDRGLIEVRNKALLESLAVPRELAASPPVTFLGQPWSHPIDLYEEGTLVAPAAGFELDSALVKVEDLERFININTASVEVLESIPGLSRTVVRRINFQRSGTDEGGARLEEGPVAFHDIAELRYLRGIDEEAWYGEGDGPGLRDLLTTFGDGRININTTTRDVLAVLPGVGESAADDIVTCRNGDDGLAGTEDDLGFTDWKNFATATKIGGDTLASLKRHCKFDSDFFKITGEATRRGGRIRATCAAVVRIPDGSNVASLVSWTEESLGSQ